jgi:hypothetical protein
MQIKKTTPILCVDSIEETLPFYTDTLDYAKVTEVPQVAKILKAGSHLLSMKVDSISQTQKTLVNATVLMPLRKTFYGTHEIWVRRAHSRVKRSA